MSSADAPDLGRRFGERLDALGVPAPGDRVVVAVSGGVDSLVLLHLLRFGPGAPSFELVAAHFDHRMRPESPADARWIRGLLRAWEVDGRFGRADQPPESEEEAREGRYAFLRGVKRAENAAWILTAHHADDQAETVLFRALRGTGVAGLAGIPERREPGIVRPLLPFWKEELEAYAARAGIRPRPDPTNREGDFARNVIRHELIPRAEEAVAAGARRALVRLARLAAGEEAAWESLRPRLLDGVLIEDGPDTTGGGEGAAGGPVVLDRSAFLEYHPRVRARLLRALVEGFGEGLDEAGTREAVEFTRAGASGRRLDLPGGLVLAREFDRLVLRRARETGPDETLVVPEAGPGRGELRIGGRRLRARWSLGPGATGEWTERFSPSRLSFPLTIRGWSPGDRIRLSYGTKKLKKLFGEHRVPRRERHRTPVVADADGEVVWIPGLTPSAGSRPDDDEAFFMGIEDADSA